MSLPKLILASGSPRRKVLLEENGFHFEVIPPDVEEIEDPAIHIRELTALNARIKADAVARNHPEAVVVAADTLVLFEDTALGKPADMEEAAAMLGRLNGNTHQVYTAVCIMRKASRQATEFNVVTDVTFKALSEEEKRTYHGLIDPLDKAGAYAAQDHGDLIIERTEGSTSNVIGLPMDELSAILKAQFRIEPQT